MVEVVILAQNLVSLHENALLLAILVLPEGNMAGEGVLVAGDGPDVKVVHLLDSIDLENALPDALKVQMIGNGLEDKHDAIPESKAGRPKDDDSEDVGEDRIYIPELRPEVDD